MNKTGTMNHEAIDNFLTDSMRYFGNLEDRGQDVENSSSELYNHTLDEVTQALQAIHEANSPVILKDYILQETDFHKSPSDSDMDLKYFYASGDIIRLCKKRGVFPYYTTFLAAAVLYDIAQDGKHPAAKQIADNGIKHTAAELLHFEFEAEMLYLIDRAYKNIAAKKPFEDEQKISLMKKVYEEGFKNESIYGGCSQCVIKSAYSVMNKHDEKAAGIFQAASSLAGGVNGCNDGTCGALIGANMIIGSIFGRELKNLDKEDDDAYEKSNRIGRAVREEFIKTYGTAICENIHCCIFGRKFNFRDPVEFKAFEEAGAHLDKCSCVVGMAGAWLIEALYNQNHIQPQ